METKRVDTERRRVEASGDGGDKSRAATGRVGNDMSNKCWMCDKNESEESVRIGHVTFIETKSRFAESRIETAIKMGFAKDNRVDGWCRLCLDCQLKTAKLLVVTIKRRIRQKLEHPEKYKERFG